MSLFNGRSSSLALLFLLLSHTLDASSTELVTNGTFNTNTSSWTTNSNANWFDRFPPPGSVSPGYLNVSNFCSVPDCSIVGYGSFNQSINIPTTSNYSLSFDFGVRVPNGAAVYPNNTNTLTILLGDSQLGTIQFSQNGVNSPSAIVAGNSMTISNSDGTSTTISIDGNRNTS
jgi:hypothetical protein